MTSILHDAYQAVHGDRNRDYGHPRTNHTATAELWRAWVKRKYGLDVPFDARAVCWMNILQKASRDANAPKRDNLTDTAGYAENAQMCEEA